MRIIWYILTRRYNHWVILNVDRKNLELLFKEEDFDVELYYHGLQPYVNKMIIKRVAEKTDDIEMLCDKVAFEVAAAEHSIKK